MGDLLSDMYFTFRIPDIYCKDVNSRDGLYTPGRPTNKQFNFAWSRYLGPRAIQTIGFYVGGQKIQEFDSEYIIAKAHCDLDQDAFYKWQTLIGDVPELNDPANGIYAGKCPNGSATGYPLVASSSVPGIQTNNPSINGQDIIVPIPFWFCQSVANSLPLVALQFHDCEVQITMRPIQELYTILDEHMNRVAPGYKVADPTDVYTNQPTYIQANNPTNDTIDGSINLFLVDFGYSQPIQNTWFFNPRIQCTFTWLTDDERKVFATQPLSYLIYQTSLYSFPGIYNRQVLDLDTHNPVNRIILVPRRSDTLQYRNDVGNYTNWLSFPERPFVPLGTQGATTISSGTLQSAQQDHILRHLRVLLDGNEIQEEKTIDYFTKVVPWKNERGGSFREARYIPVFPFCLESPSTQPSGSVNTSRVRLFQIEVDPWALPNPTNYVYNLNIYVENINWFEVASGMGGVKWSL